jgi:hypothetical protein
MHDERHTICCTSGAHVSLLRRGYSAVSRCSPGHVGTTNEESLRDRDAIMFLKAVVYVTRQNRSRADGHRSVSVYTSHDIQPLLQPYQLQRRKSASPTILLSIITSHSPSQVPSTVSPPSSSTPTTPPPHSSPHHATCPSPPPPRPPASPHPLIHSPSEKH